MIIPLLWSSGNLLEDCCLTFKTTELISTLDMLCQYEHTDLKNDETSAFGMWVLTHFGSDFPTVDRQNPTRFVLCCFHGWFSLSLADGLGFPLMWQNMSVIRRLSSSSVRIFWPYRITETAFAWRKHQPKPTSAWNELQKSHGHIICSHKLPSVWISARTP